MNFSTSCLQILHGLDLFTRTAVVTGANTGIGFETARSLALHGCHVVLACRDLSKAEAAVGKIRSERANVRCTAMKLDLASLASVREFSSMVVCYLFSNKKLQNPIIAAFFSFWMSFNFLIFLF